MRVQLLKYKRKMARSILSATCGAAGGSDMGPFMDAVEVRTLPV